LVGCAECISTECETVEVVIVDEYYRSAYTTIMFTGKVMVPVVHAAVYRITVAYNGVEYTIGGSDTYNKYKNMVGETAIGTLEIKTYDDGTVKYDIVSLE
jgi:hypothetical protein